MINWCLFFYLFYHLQKIGHNHQSENCYTVISKYFQVHHSTNNIQSFCSFFVSAHSKTSSWDQAKESKKRVKQTKSYRSDSTERQWADCSQWAPKINGYVAQMSGEQKGIRGCSRLQDLNIGCNAPDWLQESRWLSASRLATGGAAQAQQKNSWSMEANFKPTAQVSIKCDIHQSHTAKVCISESDAVWEVQGLVIVPALSRRKQQGHQKDGPQWQVLKKNVKSKKNASGSRNLVWKNFWKLQGRKNFRMACATTKHFTSSCKKKKNLDWKTTT